MKVLIANSIFFPNVIGGAEGAAHLLARRLSENGLAVDVLTTTGRRAGPAEEIRERTLEGVAGTVYEAPCCGLYDLLPVEGQRPPSLPVRGAHHFLGVHSPRWARLCRRILTRSRPDIVHTHTIVGITPAIWGAARALGLPVVHTLHDYHLLCPRTTLLRSNNTVCERAPWPCRLLAHYKLAATRHVDVVTAPSRFVLERHLAAGGFPRARAVVVPNACSELPDAVPDRSGLELTQGLFLGQIDVHKGIPILLQALSKMLAGSLPDDFRFAFAGAGPLVQEVRAFCAANPTRCRYHGVVRGEAKAALLAASSFLVLPSIWHDNFPLVILEAFSNGLPVIGARRGGIPEIIDHEINGQVVSPEPTPLAEAMSVYATSSVVRQQHGEAALAKARQYSFERHIDSFVEIYERTLTDRRAQPQNQGPASTA